MTDSINHQFFFPHQPELVWEYLTRAELMELWLMPNDFLPISGHEFQFRIKPMPQLDFDGIVYCKVLEIVPHQRLSYSWKSGPGNGKIELDSIVIWKLIPKENGTELLLEHTGFRGFDNFSMFTAMNDGWFKNMRKIAELIKTANKMKKQDYTASILVRATANEAFKGINHVAAWWTENLEGSSEKLNDVFILHFGEAFVTMKIVESVPDKKVVWNVTDCYLHWLADKKEWKDTQIVYEISTEGDSSRIQFTHVGLEPQVECYDGCVKGWDQYFKGSLAKLINEGQGLPQRKATAAAAAVK